MKTNFIVNDIFDRVKGQLGFVPNLYKEMSQSPAVLEVYHKGQEALPQGGLTAKEQQVVQLTVAVYNDCLYCKAAHQWLGEKMGLSQDQIQKIRSGLSEETPTEVTNLVRATKLILENRGWIDPEELTRFEQQGISRVKLYEIIAFIGLKTISNYINHIAETPIDEQFNS
jgi:AhpD family alkylhydroperoxidase